MIFSKDEQWSLVKLNIQSKWSMTFCQIRHGLLPYVSIFYLLIHLFTQFIIYLPINHPPTHLLFTYLYTYLFTYTFSPTYLHTYLYFSHLYDLLTYVPTYLHIICFPIHPLIYLILTTRCNHQVQPLNSAIKFTQILAIKFILN